ncbi:hypothetical protein V5799_010191, partial [Amblyomma americanum]
MREPKQQSVWTGNHASTVVVDHMSWDKEEETNRVMSDQCYVVKAAEAVREEGPVLLENALPFAGRVVWLERPECGFDLGQR